MAQNRLRDCLNARVEAGVFSKEKADMLEALATDLEKDYRATMSVDMAGMAAAAEAVRILREAAEANKRRTALQILAQTRALADAAAHPDGAVAGGMAQLVPDDVRGKATNLNVQTQIENVERELFRRSAAGLEAYRSKAAGLVQDVAGMKNVIRELRGEATNDATAKGFAKGFRESSEYAADRYITGGGDLAKRDDWNHPQHHEAKLIREAGFQQWRDDILPLLDDRTWSRLESMRQELIGERRLVEDSIGAATKERDSLRGNARASKKEFESARGTIASADRRIRDLEKQHGELTREIEAQQARAMGHKLNARERRLNEVERTAVDAEGLTPTREEAAAAARRGDAKAGRDRVRASEADTALSRLEARRADLERQLDAQRARKADAEAAVKEKSGHWQAHEEDARRIEQHLADLENNRRIIKGRITSEPGAINAAHRDDVLRYIFDQMTSEVPPSLKPGTMVASRHNARRFFVFADSDSFLRYNAKYGVGDGGLYELFVGHLKAMARDIALTEVLGPKHGATVRALQEQAWKWKAEQPAGTAIQRAGNFAISALESPAAIGRTYDVLSGRLGSVQNELAAALFGGTRNLLTATKLGSAMVSSVAPDTFTLLRASVWNGIPPVKLLGSVLRQLNPASDADRAFAARLGFVSSSVSDAALGTKRFSDQIVGDGITARFASFVIRAQGLAAWTDGLKRAFVLEFMGYIGDNVGRSRAELSKPLRRMMDRYGITAAEWDVLRAAPLLEHQGARFFDPAGVPDRAIAEKLMGAIVQERAYAVIEPGARIRQITTAGLQRGTVMGEVARSASLFKTFAFTMMVTHLMRAAQQPGVGGKLAAFGGLFAGLTVAGAVSMQAKAIVQGKDPREMAGKDWKEFWAAAALQGGALGFFGDFLSTAVGRDGNTVVTSLFGGPVAGLGNDVLRLGIPNLRQLYDGTPTKFGSEIARFARYNLAPLILPGSNLWYAKTAADRTVLDFLQSLIDPDYRQSFARMEERARKDYGQRFWWRPGQAPDRAPDLGAAMPR